MNCSISTIYGIKPLTYEESLNYGGSKGLDHEVVKGIGMGVGFTLKKLIKVLGFLSNNIYEMQKNALILYQ